MNPKQALAKLFWHYGLSHHSVEAATKDFLALTGTTPEGIKWRMGAYR